MRQIGDRLVPVGITSGRIHPLSVDGAEGEGGGSRRSRRRQQQQQELNSFLGNMGFGGRDLEEVSNTNKSHSYPEQNADCFAYPSLADDDGGHEVVFTRARCSTTTGSGGAYP